LVEHIIRNDGVVGSIPIRGTTYPTILIGFPRPLGAVTLFPNNRL
jgi:hypothetical protein